MRLALIFLFCAAGFFQGGYAQAPGTLDPAKAASKQDPPTPDAARPDLSKQDSGDLTIRTNVNVVIADVSDEPLSLVVAVQRSSNLTDFLPKIQNIGSMLNQLVAGQNGEIAVVGF